MKPTIDRKSQQDKLLIYKPGLHRECPACGRNLLKTDFHKKHGRCKLCQDNARPSCGCGCGAHPEKEYEIYAPDIPSRGKDVGSYFLTQKCLSKERKER